MLLHENLTVYSLDGESIKDIKIFGRPSSEYSVGGQCQCILQACLHSLLLWNAGNGMLFCYKYLINCVHSFVAGHDLHAQFQSRQWTIFNIFGVSTTLQYHTFRRAVVGEINFFFKYIVKTKVQIKSLKSKNPKIRLAITTTNISTTANKYL